MFINEGKITFNIQDILAFLEEAKFIQKLNILRQQIILIFWPQFSSKENQPSIVLGFFNINFEFERRMIGRLLTGHRCLLKSPSTGFAFFNNKTKKLGETMKQK